MVTGKVTGALVFWMLIPWSTGGIKRSALSHRSSSSNNTINGSSTEYISGETPLRPLGYFVFSNQNGTIANRITGGGSLGSVGNNKSESSGSGQIPQDSFIKHVLNNTYGQNFILGNISNPSLGTFGKDLVGATNGPFSILGGSRPRNSQNIINVPPNNGSSGHPYPPYVKRPVFAASLPLNVTNKTVVVPPNNGSYLNLTSNIIEVPLDNNSINTTVIYPFQPNSSGNYGTAGPVNNGGNPSGNLFQQIGNGFKFVQEVAQNISSSASNNFAQWLPNAAQNGSGKSNESQNGGFRYEWHWPGGNWSFELPGNNVSRLTVGESLNGGGFIETQARNNSAHDHVRTGKIVGVDNSETRIKKDEHHELHPNTKSRPAKKKFHKKKHHREHEGEEHKSLV